MSAGQIPGAQDRGEEDRAAGERPHRRVRPVWRLALWSAALVGGFYLLREHAGHLLGLWPYLLLLACPLMHFFHGHGHGSKDKAPDTRVQEHGGA